MAKRLTRIEMKILAKTLTEKAGKRVEERKREREGTERIHKARLMALSEKFLRKHGKQILALAVLNVETRCGRWYRDTEQPVGYYLESDYPLKWTDDTEAQRKQLAAEFAEFLQEVDFQPLPPLNTTFVHFTALDETIAVPADEEQRWRNLADKIDMAVIDGDAKQILDLIQEFTK